MAQAVQESVQKSTCLLHLSPDWSLAQVSPLPRLSTPITMSCPGCCATMSSTWRPASARQGKAHLQHGQQPQHLCSWQADASQRHTAISRAFVQRGSAGSIRQPALLWQSSNVQVTMGLKAVSTPFQLHSWGT